MRYTFNDIDNKDMYSSCSVMFIAGQYNIFNNIVSDKLKEIYCHESEYEEDEELLDEFGISRNNEDTFGISNSVDFNTFIDVVNTPNINGKWFCKVDIESLNKKQQEVFDAYIKAPNKNGVLVAVSREYKQFRGYLRNKAFQLGASSHLIQLGFPNRHALAGIVTELFASRGVAINTNSAELFVMKMSSAYDEYESMIDKISLGYEGNTLSYEQMVTSLKGVENYVIDDFIEALLKPLKSDKIAVNRSIYKMLGALLRDMGAPKLVSALKYKIDDYIEFRIAINSGLIPIKVRYSLVEIKGRLGNSRIAKISDFRFRKMAYIASQTSLKDWTYMKLILNNANLFDANTYERVLYTLVHRTVFSQNRLNNDIGIDNIMQQGIKDLDKISYQQQDLMLALVNGDLTRE